MEWQQSCDGSVIETVKDQSKILGIRASTVHSARIIEWTIHCIDGSPVTAEYRESTRGRISEGEKTGEYSGTNQLTRIETFKFQNGRFEIPDKILGEELAEILTKAKAPRD